MNNFEPRREASPARKVDILSGKDYLGILYGRRSILLSVIAGFLVLATIARFILPQQYEGVVVMIPTAPPGQTSANSIASLVNLNLLGGGGASDDRKSVALATIISRSFLQDFIVNENLMPVLFARRWNAELKRWRGSPPTLEDGFRTLSGAITVDAPIGSSIVKLHVKWSDAKAASRIANQLVAKLNGEFQVKAIDEADRTISYMTDAYQRTALEEVRTSIANLIVQQIKQRIMAKSVTQYAMTVVDPAEPSSEKVSPGLTVLLAAGLFLGILFGVPAAFFWDKVASSSKDRAGEPPGTDGTQWPISS